jgi:translation initiation factor 2B subunit (eIF-2B alpha/beta/delta family)
LNTWNMTDLPPLISDIAQDRVSGATEIAQRAIEVLRRVMSQPAAERLEVSRAICHAQPAMASLWNAALAAANDEGQPARFERFMHRVQRAPSALTRFACQLFTERDAAGAAVNTEPLSLVTLSSSASVRRAFEALAHKRAVRVACAEGRPALEGRRMAETLAEGGIAVTLFSDAAIAEAVHDATAVVFGADAVASDWFMNKVGTRMLAAAASMAGVPVYVIASADKFCAPALSPCIRPRDGGADEIWDAPPARVVLRNPYFERVPLELVVAVITDGGIMPAADVPAFCASLGSSAPIELVRQLAQ